MRQGLPDYLENKLGRIAAAPERMSLTKKIQRVNQLKIERNAVILARLLISLGIVLLWHGRLKKLTRMSLLWQAYILWQKRQNYSTLIKQFLFPT